MTKWVSTDYDGCSYITPGKRYEVKGQDDTERSFIVDLDNGIEGYCLYEECSHINNGKWTVHDTPAITIEPGKYYRTRDGQRVGPMREDDEGDFDVVQHDDPYIEGQVWNPDGTVWGEEGDKSDHYLIAEWTDTPTRDQELTSPYGDGNHPLPPTTGTLRELNVKPGDVVEFYGEVNTVLSAEIIPQGELYGGKVRANLSEYGRGIFDTDKFRNISRASTYDPEQEVDQLRNERDAMQAVIDGAGMMERAYKDSAEAYNAIHAALTYEVEASLESCEYASAMKAAELMRDIEGHTDIKHGDA